MSLLAVAGWVVFALTGIYSLALLARPYRDGGVRMMMQWQAYTLWAGMGLTLSMGWHPLNVLWFIPFAVAVVPPVLMHLRMARAMRKIEIPRTDVLSEEAEKGYWNSVDDPAEFDSRP